MARDRYYLTTPIFYPNGKPHIGHAYTAIASDALAASSGSTAPMCSFLSGTDEHGIKMLQTAQAEGISPKALADRNSAVFQHMLEAMGVLERRFHPDDGAAPLRSLPGNLAEGWRRMETSISTATAAGIPFDRKPISTRVRPQSAKTVSAANLWIARRMDEEQSYFFRLSAYQDRLLAHYEAHPDFVGPAERRNEVISFVKSGLKDLSISRTTFDWGVPFQATRST